MPNYLNAFLEGDRVVLLYRGSGGELLQRRAPAEWVSYHRGDQVAPHRRELRRTSHVAATRDEGPWVRVSWRSWESRRSVCLSEDGPLTRAGVVSMEADVGPVRRLIADQGLAIARPRRAYFDIETDSRVPFAEKERARIVAWALVDEAGAVTSHVLEADSDDAERASLKLLWAALERFDQVVAWYGDGFDFPVLHARTRLLMPEVEKHVRRILWLDHLVLYKRMNTASESGDEKQSLKLQDVAMSIVGEGKDDFDASKTWQSWAAGGEERARMARYNVKDTQLLRLIEEKTGFCEVFQNLCEACRVFPDSASTNPTLQVDGFMLRLGVELGHHFPTKRYDDNQNAGQYAGAYVMEPSCSGIVSDVHVCDFGSMYPNIAITWNMSLETKVGRGVEAGPGTCKAPATGVVFRTDVEGILPLALRTLLDLRKSWNKKKAEASPGTPEHRDADRRATAYKVAANSFYGVMGSSFSRFYDRDVAESISQQGVWLIQRTLELAGREGMRVIYSDTDSAFFMGVGRAQFQDFVRRCNEEHYPRLVRELGCTKNTTSLEAEKGFRRLVMVSKKKYVGWFSYYKKAVATADSKPEVKGLEWRRGDTAALAREFQHGAIKLLATEDDPRAYEPLILAARDNVLKGELGVGLVRLSKSLGKDLSEYVVRKKNDGDDAAEPPHIAVARDLLAAGKLDSVRKHRRVQVQEDGRTRMRSEAYQDVPAGTRIEFVVCDASRSPLQAIPAADYDGTNADRYYLWEKLVWPPTERLLAAAFPGTDWTPWGRVRPRNVGRGKALPGQLALALAEVRPVPTRPAKPRAMKRA